jgi:glycerol-3-phosphate acyltransferase PlsY
VIVPYLMGSLNFSIIVSQLLYKQDIRKFGSGNAGMTNVLRTFGKQAAALTIVGDIGKGVVAVLIAKWFLSMNLSLVAYLQDEVLGMYLAAFFAVLGHVYPLYFGFKGGKAVSVATGTILAIHPVMVLPLLAIFGIVFLCSKMVSLASICCAVSYPILTFVYYYFFAPNGSLKNLITGTLGAFLVGALVVWLHRGNIKRICSGTEYKFMQKK